MSRYLITINCRTDRDRAIRWIEAAPVGCRIQFMAEKRTIDQNSLLWARLQEVAKAADWHQQKLTPADWKDIFTASLVRARVVPNLDGDGFVQLGLHTSDMSKDEMGNLLDLIDAFAAEHGIIFKDSPRSEADEAPAVSPPSAPQRDGTAGATNPAGIDPATSSRGSAEGRAGDAMQATGAAVTSAPPRPGDTISPMDLPAAGIKPGPRETNPDSSDVPGTENNGAPADGGGADQAPLPPDNGDGQPPPSLDDEASLLSDDWQSVYLSAMARVNDRPKSLLTRHNEALQMIGGKPYGAEREWMKAVYRLTERRLRGEITKDECDEAVRQI